MPVNQKKSRRARYFIMGVAMVIFLAWYFGLTARLEDRKGVAAALPAGVALETVAEYVHLGAGYYHDVSVERKLAGLGASVKNGKLYDSAGREIRFFSRYGGGAKPPPHMLQELEEERARLKSQFTVIDLAPNNPRNPPPH